MLLLTALPAQAQLRGHGGPVRALAVSPDGTRVVSGSFDTTAIRWSLASGTAEKVLRFHEGAVNAVVFLSDGRVATSGEDARIAIWRPGDDTPMTVLEGHTAPVVGLAVSPDGKLLASAAWDHTARLWPLGGGEPRVLEGHQQTVNGLPSRRTGARVITAGYDATLRIWPLGGGSPTVVTLPTPLNAVAVAPDGDIVAAGASGKVYFLSAAGAIEGRGRSNAGSDHRACRFRRRQARRGLQHSRRHRHHRARAGARSSAPWSAPACRRGRSAFLPDNTTLLTGGTDRLVRRWNAMTGEHIGEVTMSGPADPLAA